MKYSFLQWSPSTTTTALCVQWSLRWMAPHYRAHSVGSPVLRAHDQLHFQLFCPGLDSPLQLARTITSWTGNHLRHSDPTHSVPPPAPASGHCTAPHGAALQAPPGLANPEQSPPPCPYVTTPPRLNSVRPHLGAQDAILLSLSDFPLSPHPVVLQTPPPCSLNRPEHHHHHFS